ncbi:hypothetical protein CWD85_30820 [Burkholderia pseudomallei]|nr:hypothetical protein CWD85_30820 [Burkholderia pseudomallei]
MSDVRCPMPDARCPVSGVRCPVSGVRCPVSAGIVTPFSSPAKPRAAQEKNHRTKRRLPDGSRSKRGRPTINRRCRLPRRPPTGSPRASRISRRAPP